MTLQLYLKDTEGQVRYHFHFDCEPEQFEEVTCEEIQKVRVMNYFDGMKQEDNKMSEKTPDAVIIYDSSENKWLLDGELIKNEKE